MMMTPIYTLYEVITNPRDGSEQLMVYDQYATRAEAVRAARRTFRKRRWCVTEEHIVATGVEAVG